MLDLQPPQKNHLAGRIQERNLKALVVRPSRVDRNFFATNRIFKRQDPFPGIHGTKMYIYLTSMNAEWLIFIGKLVGKYTYNRPMDGMGRWILGKFPRKLRSPWMLRGRFPDPKPPLWRLDQPL